MASRSESNRASRRRFLGWIGATAALSTTLLATACAQPTAPTPAAAQPADKTGAAPKAAAPATGAKVESIKYQQRQSGAEDFVRKKYGPEFTEKTGIKVVLEDIPDAEYFTKILALSAARQLGDLAFGFNSGGHLVSWAYKGITAPLDDMARTDNFDLNQFYSACIDACRFEGKLHALPTVGHPGEITIYHNNNMFEEAGVKLPDANWNFDSIVDAATKLTKTSGGRTTQFGYASGRSWFQLIARLRQFGGDILSEDGKTTLLNTDASKAALQWEYDMNYKHKAAPTPTEIEGDNVGQMFTNGRSLAMNSNNVANITLYKAPIADKFKWGVIAWPKGPAGSRGATVHTNVTHITSQAKAPEAAWDFLKLITSHEAGVEKILMGSGSPGARPDVWSDKRLWNLDPWYEQAHAIMQEAKAPHMAFNLKTPEVDSVLIQRTSEIWVNSISPADGAAKMAQEIQAILDQPR
jgi:multiple sugar transport system substrate-binding protein